MASFSCYNTLNDTEKQHIIEVMRIGRKGDKLGNKT